jgi:rubredoxin
MQCPRCETEMMEEQFSDSERADGIIWMRGWRCRVCGHAKDPLREVNHCKVESPASRDLSMSRSTPYRAPHRK